MTIALRTARASARTLVVAVAALFLVVASCLASGAAARLELGSAPELLLPGIVSTEASEIRLARSPDGARLLWGAINRPGGPGGWEIWESVREGDGWSAPRPATFDSPQNDFDPAFAPDGRGLYFFSNRPGGSGGDDLWFVPFDEHTKSWGTAENLGPAVNSPGDEWAPVPSPDGSQLLFASDGRGGRGRHDLFVATRRDGRWAEAKPLGGELNTAEEEFDASFLGAGEAIVFTRRVGERDGADLFVSFRTAEGYGPGEKLDARVNAPETWNLGPSVSAAEPGWLTFTSHREGASSGRLDLYRISFRLVD